MESGTKRSVIGSWNQTQAIFSQKHEIRHKTFCYRNTESGTKSYYRNMESGTKSYYRNTESGTKSYYRNMESGTDVMLHERGIRHKTFCYRNTESGTRRYVTEGRKQDLDVNVLLEKYGIRQETLTFC